MFRSPSSYEVNSHDNSSCLGCLLICAGALFVLWYALAYVVPHG